MRFLLLLEAKKFAVGMGQNFRQAVAAKFGFSIVPGLAVRVCHMGFAASAISSPLGLGGLATARRPVLFYRLP